MLLLPRPTHKHIKKPLMKVRWSLNASGWINKVFFDKGGEGFEPGEFVIQEVSHDNNFLCQRVGSESPPELFDMSYAITRVKEYEEE